MTNLSADNGTVPLGALADGTLAANCLIEAGMSGEAAKAKGVLFARACDALLLAGHPPGAAAAAFFVPGRIEVLGKHTDYCGGRSLLCAVDRGMCFVAVARQDGQIHFSAMDLNERASIRPRIDQSPPAGHWSNYPHSVALRFEKNFPHARHGADIYMASDLPKASGLSSSSAMIVGSFLVLSRINRLCDSEVYRQQIPDNEALAGYLGAIESGQSFGALLGNKGVGTFGGSQDHTAILCCKPGRLSVYSFCPVRHRSDVDLPRDVVFVVADSGVIAEKTGAAREQYNHVAARARELVSIWNATGHHIKCVNDLVDDGDSLRQLHNMLLARADGIDLAARLDQFLAESNRLIPQAATAIADRDWAALRQIADESQALAEANLHNQVPQTIALQRTMLATGALAASVFGAGFGGSVWGLFDEQGVSTWNRLAVDRRSFITRPGCGATQIF